MNYRMHRFHVALGRIKKSILSVFVVVLVTAVFLAPRTASADGQLVLTVVDEKTQKPVACRMHLVGPNKRPRKVDRVPYWTDHFVVPGKITLKLPLGTYAFEVYRGPEYLNRVGNFTINHFADDTKTIELRRATDLAAEGWWSGDLCVRRPVRDIELLMAAEDLHVVEAITWSNDKNPWPSQPVPKNPLVVFDRNRAYQILAGGQLRGGTELLLFHLAAPLAILQDNKEYPPILKYLPKARETGAWLDLAAPDGWDLPLLVAHGQVDSIEIANSHFCRQGMTEATEGRPRDPKAYPGGTGYARWTQHIYFQLLECGLRIPPTAGSGSGAAPNPVGYNRVYVHLDGDFSYEQWWKNLRAGQAMVTNGPLPRVKVHGQYPGHVFSGDEGQELELEVGLTISLDASEPIRYLEIIKNGQIEHSLRFEEYAQSGRLPKVKFTESGWFVVRVVAETQKTYRFAMTAPYYVEFAGRRRASKKAAQFFLDWVYQRARQIRLDDAQQRREVLDYHRKARDFWQDLVAKANAG